MVVSKYAYVIMANLLDYPEVLMFKGREERLDVWTLPGGSVPLNLTDTDFLTSCLREKLPDIKFSWENRRSEEEKPVPEKNSVIRPYYPNLEGQHFTCGISVKADVYLANLDDLTDLKKVRAYRVREKEIGDLYPGNLFPRDYLPRQRNPDAKWISIQDFLFNPDMLAEFYATRLRNWNIGVISRDVLRRFTQEYKVARDIGRDANSYSLNEEKSEKSKRVENAVELWNLRNVPVQIFP